MPVRRRDEWIQIAELTEDDRIKFTQAFLAIVDDEEGDATRFVGHLLGLWFDPFEHLLDYNTGDAKHTTDQPGQASVGDHLNGDLDVVEYWAMKWAANDNDHEPGVDAGLGVPGLDADWYRDILRAKLVSLRVPRRLLEEYVEKKYLDR